MRLTEIQGGPSLTLPAEDPRRQAVRDWLVEHPSPSGAELASAGLVAPHWPRPWGLDADPLHQLLVDDELRSAGVKRPVNPIGLGWAGPTILQAGTDEQRARYLPGILDGSDFWCQLFSEPDAGSDLASLRTTAVRDGDEWIIRGQKLWTTFAHRASHAILIARTDATGPKHHGITYFVCDMSSPGIEIRPIVDMTGWHEFNEVFLNDVRIPAENVVGEVGGGWAITKMTLGNERVSLSAGGVLWGTGPTAQHLLDVVRASGAEIHPVIRQRLVALHVEDLILRLLRLRTVSATIQGRAPGPEASIRKLFADHHGQHVMQAAKDLAGTNGLLVDGGPLGAAVDRWHFGFLFAPALTIGGGTSEVQRSIIGERVLGLPAEPEPCRA